MALGFSNSGFRASSMGLEIVLGCVIWGLGFRGLGFRV